MKNKAWILISLLLPIFTANVVVDQELENIIVFPKTVERRYVNSVNLSKVEESYDIYWDRIDFSVQFYDYGAGMPNTLNKNNSIKSKLLVKEELRFLSDEKQELVINDYILENKINGNTIEIKIGFEPFIVYLFRKVSLYD